MTNTATIVQGKHDWILRPGDPVPFSGIYDVVDDHGRYLEYQRAVTQPADGHSTFPALDDARAEGYILRAAPLNLTQPDPRYSPGNIVPFDGIYDVVDDVGRWVGTQKVCVAGDPFPPLTLGASPLPFVNDPSGYALHLRAVDHGHCPP